jgi:ribosomal protein S18 acetylase RimI-like enzyme
MTPISIRNATVADCQDILECLGSAFERYQSSYTPEAYEDTVLNSQVLDLRLREMCVLVAVTEPEENVVGTLAFSIAKAGEGHLRGMGVRPDWQGRGIAKRLLDYAEVQLRSQNCRRVTLDTTAPLLRAINFYERNGYAATGREIDFFGMPLFEYAKNL